MARRPPPPASPRVPPASSRVPPASSRVPPARSAPGKSAAKGAATKSGTTRAGTPRAGAKRSGSSRSPSRPAGSSRPRPGAVGRSGNSGSVLRAGGGRPLWVLGGVAVVLALLILPYLQKWLVQRADIAAARADVVQSRREVAELEREQRRWNDPDYVKAQARERLHFVMPGETGFVVADPPSKTAAEADPGRQAAKVAVEGRPWFGDVWESVKVAGDPVQRSP